MKEDFPKESLPNNTHTFAWNRRFYDTYKLVEYGNNIKPIKIEVSDLSEQLDRFCWKDTNGNSFPPIMLAEGLEDCGSWEALELENPEWSIHIKKVKEADSSYPILIHKYQIIDGRHRLLKAYIDKVTDLPVRIIDTLPDEAEVKN